MTATVLFSCARNEVGLIQFQVKSKPQMTSIFIIELSMLFRRNTNFCRWTDSSLAKLQLFVLFLCFDQNGHVRVCVFPQRKKILISLARFCGVALKRGGAREAQVRERIKVGERRPTPVIEYLLELGRGFGALLFVQVCLAAKVSDLEKSVSFIRSGRL